jgi:pimeloyl-ACP methyl ester carboxylesterase
MLTLKLAATHPERVTSAIVGGFGWSDFGAPGEGLMDRVADALAAGDGIGPLMEALTPVDEDPPTGAQLDQMNRMIVQQNDALALAACARSFRKLELSKEELMALKVPLVCVIGEKDRLKADVDRLVALRTDIEAVVVPGGNHMTAALSPLFVNTIREFAGDHELAEAR